MKSIWWGLLVAFFLSGCGSKDKSQIQAYLASTERVHGLSNYRDPNAKEGPNMLVESMRAWQKEGQEAQKLLDKTSPPEKAKALHESYQKTLKEFGTLAPIYIDRCVTGRIAQVDLGFAEQASNMEAQFKTSDDERARLIREFGIKTNPDGSVPPP